MDRIEIAQAILDKLGRGIYLEIGVSTGNSFIPIQAKRKWGVDPNYHLTRRRLIKYRLFSSLCIKDERLFPVTSDEFFEKNKRMLGLYGIDVCLVDGLHTYEQVLKDVHNALTYLKPHGVILLHDCNPSTEVMALPAHGIEEVIRKNNPAWDGSWSGDVWKAIVHLRALRRDIDAFVLDCDTGIGVVTRGQPKDLLSYTEADIRAMDYTALCRNRSLLLGLRPSEYFTGFLGSHLQS